MSRVIKLVIISCLISVPDAECFESQYCFRILVCFPMLFSLIIFRMLLKLLKKTIITLSKKKMRKFYFFALICLLFSLMEHIIFLKEILYWSLIFPISPKKLLMKTFLIMSKNGNQELHLSEGRMDSIIIRKCLIRFSTLFEDIIFMLIHLSCFLK